MYHYFPVVACDVRTIPIVKNAKRIHIPKNNGTIQPRKGNVTYACDDGLALRSPKTNAAWCEYNFTHREGAPLDDDTQLVTAVWRGQQDILCQKGNQSTFKIANYHAKSKKILHDYYLQFTKCTKFKKFLALKYKVL